MKMKAKVMTFENIKPLVEMQMRTKNNVSKSSRYGASVKRRNFQSLTLKLKVKDMDDFPEDVYANVFCRRTYAYLK